VARVVSQTTTGFVVDAGRSLRDRSSRSSGEIFAAVITVVQTQFEKWTNGNVTLRRLCSI
jgi:hypothetical protein